MATATKIPGPYWINETPSGEYRICGRNAAVLFSYPADQAAAADAHLKTLQRGYAKHDKTLRDAAPELLAALEMVRPWLAGLANENPSAAVDYDRLCWAISKAEGGAA